MWQQQPRGWYRMAGKGTPSSEQQPPPISAPAGEDPGRRALLGGANWDRNIQLKVSGSSALQLTTTEVGRGVREAEKRTLSRDKRHSQQARTHSSRGNGCCRVWRAGSRSRSSPPGLPSQPLSHGNSRCQPLQTVTVAENKQTQPVAVRAQTPLITCLQSHYHNKTTRMICKPIMSKHNPAAA